MSLLFTSAKKYSYAGDKRFVFPCLGYKNVIHTKLIYMTKSIVLPFDIFVFQNSREELIRAMRTMLINGQFLFQTQFRFQTPKIFSSLDAS